MDLLIKNYVDIDESYKMSREDILAGLLKLGYIDQIPLNINISKKQTLNCSSNFANEYGKITFENTSLTLNQDDFALAA
ncbi:hypothetical protein ABUE38_07580 [Pediococcus parvulus]|uniref:Uncharacterized protein n=1 Tax=Pediococcus parvulus TaxID=54062 RepID=A0AAP5TEL3_9LACO|nr:hypothetical protein [Pediococcus parvulus]MDV7695111.1 hypothetical protein [Pediococcus parvulus]OAD64295.1 hypothetical protein A7K95_05425 [Pediococcus parvulus]